MASTTLTPGEEAQLAQTIEMFEVITESQPSDYQSLEILKEAYSKLGRDQEVVKTSKRIAEAYVQMGQLSSAILEYETILQRFPDDPDVQKALKQIESKANNFSEQIPTAEAPAPKPALRATARPTKRKRPRPTRWTMAARRCTKFSSMEKSSAPAISTCAGWRRICPARRKASPIPSFWCWIKKESLPVEKALKILSDKSRVGYLPLEKYELDIELARSFPAEVCKRWCVLPFDRMSKSILVATANPFQSTGGQGIGRGHAESPALVSRGAR